MSHRVMPYSTNKVPGGLEWLLMCEDRLPIRRKPIPGMVTLKDLTKPVKKTPTPDPLRGAAAASEEANDAKVEVAEHKLAAYAKHLQR